MASGKFIWLLMSMMSGQVPAAERVLLDGVETKWITHYSG